MDILLRHFNPEWKVGDVLTALYLLATVGIFLGTLRALRVNEHTLQEMRASRSDQARAVFEATLFQMLGLQRELVRSFIKQAHRGPEVLIDAAGHFAGYWKSICEWQCKERKVNEISDADAVREVCPRFFEVHGSWTGPFFHTLYRTLKHIDSHPEIDRVWYTKLVRSQLAAHELLLLFYYGLTPTGSKLKQLVERYGMLEDITDAQLVRKEHRAYYASSAFDGG